MEENNKSNKSKKIISIFLSVLILLMVIIGTSYAAWHYNFVGTLTNIISTPDLEIDLLESDDEIISLSNALPMTDEEGLAQNEEFHFAVTSKTTKEMLLGYTVMVEKLDPDTGYTFLNDQDIKIYLEDFNGNVLLEPTKISELNNYKLYVGAHSHNSQNELIQDKFKLKVWIDESKTEDARSWDINTKLQYKFKLGIRANETNALTVNAVVNNGSITGSTSVQVVEGGNAKFSMTPTDSSSEGIVSCTNNQTGTMKNNTLTVSNVTSDTTCTVTYTPSTTTLFTDGTLIINEKPSNREVNIIEHGAVTNEYAALSNSNTYVFSGSTSQPWKSQKTSITSVEIGQKIEPTNTQNWFNGLTNMTAGDFTNLDTKNVTSMSFMFANAGFSSSVTSFSLTGINDWDTSQATNMSYMFSNAGYNATSWSIGDLSNWNTSKVTNMSSMFTNAGYNATSWSIGDLSNWNTSKATNMSSMFTNAGYNATSWSIGDLSNWNTSKATNMSSMFQSAGYSATIFDIGDLSNWDTSKVTNMEYMFRKVGYKTTTWNIGNLSNWDTSKVTDMFGMFNEAGYSATIFDIGDLSGWDTSKVTSMCQMFSSAGYNATTWTIGDLSGWDTSSVTSMKSMFSGTGINATSWSIGNISSWDTSKVTDMSFMFSWAGKNATTWNSIGLLKVYDTNISQMFDSCFKAKATLNIYSNPDYGRTFYDAATASDALITVNYSSATTNIDNIIATKSSNSNVVKGVQLD